MDIKGINMASDPHAHFGKIAICMGSQSDWRTMQYAATMLDDLGAAYEVKIVSAHRTPARLTAFAETAHESGFACLVCLLNQLRLGA